jgi:hypothetical protein
LQDWKKPPAAEAISGKRTMPTERTTVSFILAGDGYAGLEEARVV